jgi:hypothetical protein
MLDGDGQVRRERRLAAAPLLGGDNDRFHWRRHRLLWAN